MNIGDIKKQEMKDIIDFYYSIQEYGHIFHFDSKTLDGPFTKILEGIAEVQQLMKDSFEI